MLPQNGLVFIFWGNGKNAAAYLSPRRWKLGTMHGLNVSIDLLLIC
jgi:hypothetical protein